MCPDADRNQDHGIRSDWIDRNPALVAILRKVFRCNHRVPYGTRPLRSKNQGNTPRVDRCTICVSPAERRVLNRWLERAWGIER